MVNRILTLKIYERNKLETFLVESVLPVGSTTGKLSTPPCPYFQYSHNWPIRCVEERLNEQGRRLWESKTFISSVLRLVQPLYRSLNLLSDQHIPELQTTHSFDTVFTYTLYLTFVVSPPRVMEHVGQQDDWLNHLTPVGKERDTIS